MSTAAKEDGAVKRRNRRICTACRQLKVRCDAQQTFPAPCTRCSERRPPAICSIGVPYTRQRPLKEPAVGLANALNRSQEVATVSGAPKAPQFSDSSVAITSDSHIPPPKAGSTGSPARTLNGLATTPVSNDASDLSISEMTLGSIVIPVERAITLFNHFFTVYHPHMPLFLALLDPRWAYKNEPLLFWVIISIACRTENPSGVYSAGLLDALLEPVKSLCSDLARQPARSHGSMQALLLLCEWSFPAQRKRDDLMWSHTSMAIQLGYQLGLHRPFHSADFSSRQHFPTSTVASRERTLAWIQCFILAVETSTYNGLPLLMRPDWVINRAAAAGPLGAPAGEWLEGISHTVLAKLQVARLQYQILERLGDSPEYDNGQLPPDRSLDVQVVLRNSLTDLDMRLGSTMDTSLKLSLIKPRLLLQVFTLQMPVDTISREERAFALLDCFAASSRVIAHVAEMDKSWVWPSTLSSVLFMAVTCLLRLISLPDSSHINRADALNRISEAYAQLSMLYTTRGDHSDRFLPFIAFLSVKANASLDGSFSSVHPGTVTSRMGWANWLYELIFEAKLARQDHAANYAGLLDASSKLQAQPSEPPAVGTYDQHTLNNLTLEAPFTLPSLDTQDFSAYLDTLFADDDLFSGGGVATNQGSVVNPYLHDNIPSWQNGH